MKIFFDTEFTGLHKNTTLISIGLVDENGRTFYAEMLGFDGNQVNDWIQENVLNNLLYRTCTNNWCNDDKENVRCVGYTYYVRPKLEEWLSAYDSVELVSDVCHYDMVLFIDIFGSAFDIPKNVNPACHDINQDIAKFYNVSETEAFNISREDILSSNNYIIDDKIMKHNALYDAKVIKEIYNICQK